MFSEYDVVRLRSATSVPGVPVGTSGTILIIYPNAFYEVEFIDEADESLGTFTVPGTDLDLVWKAPTS